MQIIIYLVKDHQVHHQLGLILTFFKKLSIPLYKLNLKNNENNILRIN